MSRIGNSGFPDGAEPMTPTPPLSAEQERIWSDSGSREADITLARMLREESIAAHTALSAAGVDATNDERPLTLVERIAALLTSKGEIERRDAFIERQGYRRCDVAACNCNGWHGGHAMQRLSEIENALEDAEIEMNGKTILQGVLALRAQRDKWVDNFNRSEQFQNGPTKRAEAAESALLVCQQEHGLDYQFIAEDRKRLEALLSASRQQIEQIRREMAIELFRAGDHPALGVPVEQVQRWADHLSGLTGSATK